MGLQDALFGVETIGGACEGEEWGLSPAEDGFGTEYSDGSESDWDDSGYQEENINDKPEEWANKIRSNNDKTVTFNNIRRLAQFSPQASQALAVPLSVAGFF